MQNVLNAIQATAQLIAEEHNGVYHSQALITTISLQGRTAVLIPVRQVSAVRFRLYEHPGRSRSAGDEPSRGGYTEPEKLLGVIRRWSRRTESAFAANREP